MIDRSVQQIFPVPQQAAIAVCQFSQCLSHRNIILLGDPGSGKTHVFQQCRFLTGGEFVTARQFLNTPKFKDGATLFIDGLDERRSGRGDQDVIDLMVQKLFRVEPVQVRIACRAQDWLGESDITAFRSYFEERGDLAVFALLPLSDAEQETVLLDKECVDPRTFLEEARRRGLSEFLGNPQNLLMLAEVVADGKWPATRKELYQEATRLLLTEIKRTRSGGRKYLGEELRAAAGAVCAARLISDVEGVSMAEFSQGDDFPNYRTIDLCDVDKILAALGRRCFVSTAVPETVNYAHRTVAEYLAAEWLADRIRHGLPLGRLRSLLGVDGSPSSELRGLNAWLAALLPEHAHQLIDGDPYGVLTYGDAASLSPSGRLDLLCALEALSKKDPWFRSGNWSSRHRRSPGTDMVESYRAIPPPQKPISASVLLSWMLSPWGIPSSNSRGTFWQSLCAPNRPLPRETVPSRLCLI